MAIVATTEMSPQEQRNQAILMTDQPTDSKLSSTTKTGSPEKDPRVYLAVERTFLAWIRTGLAMMGFGFVVARFGVFLREIAAVHPINPQHSPKLSLWFGTALVVLGSFVNLIAVRQHLRVIRQLKHGEADFARPSAVGISVAILLASLGLAMVGYLLALGLDTAS